MAHMKQHCCTDQFWLYLVAVVCLLMFSGLMSGLTLGLMSLGLVDLEVIKESGTPKDRMNASKIIPVVRRQHLLLVTLLVGNAVAMEALPLFLDGLMETWMAILVSVTLLLMFGEILPQAVCSRYGLAVGATMAPVVRVMLVVMFPIAWPVSKLLDRVLGIKHNDLFRRAELITLVHLHGYEAGKGGELTRHETSLIAGTLQLAGKTVKDAMTPIASVVSIDVQSRIDDDIMKKIVASGHSRIPVYSGKPNNIIGLILVKNFLNVTVDQHSKNPIIDVPIRRIQRISEDVQLHDVLHEFCQRRSHIAVVVRSSKIPGQDKALIHRSFADKDSTMDTNHTNIRSGCTTVLDTSDLGTAVENDYFEDTNRSSKDPRGNLTNSTRDSSSYFNPPDVDVCGQEPWATWTGEEGDDIVGIITREDVLEELLKVSLDLDKSECKVPIMDQDQEPPVAWSTVNAMPYLHSPTQRHQLQPPFQSSGDADFQSLSCLLSNTFTSPVARPSSFVCESPDKRQINLSFPPRRSSSAPTSPLLAPEHSEHTISETWSNSTSNQSSPHRTSSPERTADASTTLRKSPSLRVTDPRSIPLRSPGLGRSESTPVRSAALSFRSSVTAVLGPGSPAPSRQVATHRILHSR